MAHTYHGTPIVAQRPDGIWVASWSRSAFEATGATREAALDELCDMLVAAANEIDLLRTKTA